MTTGDSEAERLRAENDHLRQEVEELEHHRSHRFRRVSAWVVLVLACLLAIVSVQAVFIRNEALNTDRYVATVAPLAQDPAVQSAVANKVSDALLAKVDVKSKVQQALPARADFLASPIASGVDTAVHAAVLKFVQSKQFATLWTQINERAHRQLVALLTGDTTGPVTSTNGVVSLDLGQVADQAKQALDKRGITIFDKVPTGNGPELVLFQSDQLAKAQALTRQVNRLALALPLVTLLLFIGAVLLALNRRRGFVRATLGLAVSMGLILLGFDIGRNIYLHALPSSIPSNAAASAYDIITSHPLVAARWILGVSLVAALIALAVGNPWIRAHLQTLQRPSWLKDGPFIRFVTTFRKALMWVVVGIGALVLFTWDNPSAAVVIVVVLVTAAVVALVSFVTHGPAAAGVVLALPGGGTVGSAPAAGPDTPAKATDTSAKATDTPAKTSDTSAKATDTKTSDTSATEPPED